MKRDPYKVEKGVPVPPARRHALAASATRWPWPTMEAGDSIWVAGVKEGRAAAKSAASWVKRHRPPGWSSVSRQTPEGVRVWILDQEVER